MRRTYSTAAFNKGQPWELGRRGAVSRKSHGEDDGNRRGDKQNPTAIDLFTLLLTSRRILSHFHKLVYMSCQVHYTIITKGTDFGQLCFYLDVSLVERAMLLLILSSPCLKRGPCDTTSKS